MPGVPILGTSPDAIDLAEDRERFQQMLHQIGHPKQPINAIARSPEEAKVAAHQVGYPVVIRPSYVLGGRAMEIVRDDEQLARYVTHAVQVSGDSPVLIDQYLSRATEVDVDAICDGDRVLWPGSWSISRRPACTPATAPARCRPSPSRPETIAELKRQTEMPWRGR